MIRRQFAVLILLFTLLVPYAAFAQQPQQPAEDPMITRIKDEGLNRSQVMQTLSYLSDVIGQRLTGSPSLLRANEWTRDTMTKWGMQNGHLEAWGPFGRGWVLKSFAAQVSSPYAIPLIALPKAWAPGTKGVLNADVVYLDAKDDAALEKYKGQLKGKIVLMSDIRPLKADFTGIGKRVTDEDLAKMGAAPDPATVQRPNNGGAQANPEFAARRAAQLFAAKKLLFLVNEGAAMAVDNSRGGFGGTIFVQQAVVAQEPPANPPDP